jgi:hypothetical protein
LGGCGDGEKDMKANSDRLKGYLFGVITSFMVMAIANIMTPSKIVNIPSFALYTFEDKSGMWYRLRLEDLRVLEVNKGIVPLPTEFRCSSSVGEIAEKYIDKIERMEP